jgi:hypothetical protein
MRLFLLMSGALNLFWFMGQLTFESFTNTRDDWHWALHTGSPGLSRSVGAAAGVVGYVLVKRLVAAINNEQGGSNARAIRVAYAAAAASAAIAGLMWRPEPFRSALEGFLVLGVAPIGLLSIARSAGRDVGNDIGTGSVPRSWIWIAVCALLFGLFLFIQARGVGSMAAAS